VRTPLPNLGEGMQRLLGTYATYFNGRYGESGHVFKRPFRSERIKDDVHLAVAIGYVAENPVAAGLCESAAAWRWSSHGTEPDLHRASLHVNDA
jgi:putative transposase